MATKALRGVSDEEWGEIKAMANKESISMGRYIVKLATKAKSNGGKAKWEKLLSWKAKDPKEVEGIEERIKEFRKGFELRHFK